MHEQMQMRCMQLPAEVVGLWFLTHPPPPAPAHPFQLHSLAEGGEGFRCPSLPQTALIDMEKLESSSKLYEHNANQDPAGICWSTLLQNHPHPHIFSMR